uniref:Vacuolar protein sorting-associated protein 37A n=1 Tax=Cacopsylla melanoneura TaxID=428564 RepID=A0A8D9DVN1_9HEMI
MYQEDLQQERWRQINTLKIFNDNVSEVIDNAEYRIDFTSGPNKFSLNVILMQDFPLNKPILKISPAIRHFWVNPIGDEIISAPGLLNFTRHSDLGRVVQAVIRELQLRPPVVTSHIQNHHAAPSNQIPSSNYSNQHYHQVHPSYSNPPQPSLPSDIPGLDELSLTELRLLDQNEDYLNAFVKSLPHIQQLDNVIDSLISTNESLASDNLEQEQKLKELSLEMKEKVGILTGLQEKHEIQSHQYDQLVERYSPHSIKDQLLTSVMHHEDESDRLVEDFLGKQIDLDTFLNTYMEKRRVAHRLRVKEERLKYQLDALAKASH